MTTSDRVKDLASQLPKVPAIEIPASQIANEAIKGTAVDELLDKLADFHADFEGFVRWAFPWGEAGTALEGFSGPEEWQVDQQRRISALLWKAGPEGCVIEEDVASGHGIGKSAEVSWAILWGLTTFPDTKGVVTANTDLQLRTKTWAELAKWHAMFIGKHLFKLTATSICIANDDERSKTWRIDQVPWSKENTEAFAGMHNQGKRILVIFDEASNIDDKIWEVTRGALTDAKTQIIWLRFGNPTRTTGEFFKQCSKMIRPGDTHSVSRVDSRRVSFTNKKQIQAWIDEYGEDSDFVRVRVKGMFPRSGYDNFISPGLLVEARRRRVPFESIRQYQKVLAIDPARFGDDFSVISLRQGRRLWWQKSFSGYDGPNLAGKVLETVRTQGMLEGLPIPPGAITAIVYDAIGNGADLDSALRRIPNLGPVLIASTWGDPAKAEKEYFNQRSEAWGKMRDWLETAQIPDDDDLAEQCSSLLYGYDGRMRIQLESKKDAKKRGIKSPDKADSLALSFLVDLIDRKVVTAKVRPQTQRKRIWNHV